MYNSKFRLFFSYLLCIVSRLTFISHMYLLLSMYHNINWISGACMRSKTNFSKDSLEFAPFTLLPSTFPKEEFEKALSLQKTVNELIHKVAHDHQFLEETLKK